MTEDFSVTVKFPGTFNDRIDGQYGHTGGWVNLPGSGMVYGSLPKVKAKAKTFAEGFVAAAVRNAENRERQLIVTGDGHVLVVAYDDGWFYSIANESRDHKYAGSCSMSGDFKTVCAAARSHAEQCFGGVSWENRL